MQTFKAFDSLSLQDWTCGMFGSALKDALDGGMANGASFETLKENTTYELRDILDKNLQDIALLLHVGRLLRSRLEGVRNIAKAKFGNMNYKVGVPQRIPRIEDHLYVVYGRDGYMTEEQQDKLARLAHDEFYDNFVYWTVVTKRICDALAQDGKLRKEFIVHKPEGGGEYYSYSELAEIAERLGLAHPPTEEELSFGHGGNRR